MESLTQKRNFFGAKFLIDNIKKFKGDVLYKNPFLKSFLVTPLEKVFVTKTYYDTPDNFFYDNGINIHLNTTRGNKNSELIIRYNNNNKQRINFLLDLPETFTITLKSKESIFNYLNKIAYSVTEIVPSGLHINIEEKVKKLEPVIIAKKNRDRFRAIKNNGLKLNLSFDYTEYSSSRTKLAYKLELFEISSENESSYAREFENTIKSFIFEKPYLIRLHDSDYAIGKEYLF